VNKIVFLLFASILSVGFAQQDGYWDKERATTKEVIVSARDRIVIKTDDFPVTTELIYRITLLDDNQKIANSLVSLLKAVPDPTGIVVWRLFSCCLEFQEMIKAGMLFFVK
jgi:hypothetical protein